MYDVCNCDECRRERKMRSWASSRMLGEVIVWLLIILMVSGLIFLAVAY